MPQCMLGCHTPLRPGRPPQDQADLPGTRTRQTTPRDQADTPRDQDQVDIPPGPGRHLPGTRTRQTPPQDQADTPQDQADTPQDQTDPPGKQTPACGLQVAGTHPTGMHSCFLSYCRAIKQGTVLGLHVGVYSKTIQWHIQAGSWSLVNCWWEALTRHYIRCS